MRTITKRPCQESPKRSAESNKKPNIIGRPLPTPEYSTISLTPMSSQNSKHPALHKEEAPSRGKANREGDPRKSQQP